MLTACLDWCRFPVSNSNLSLEQNDSKVILSDWLFTDLRCKPDFKATNRIVKNLAKICRICQNKLVPAKSPLITLVCHLEFDQIKQSIDLNFWQQQGFIMFRDLFVQDQMVFFEHLNSIIKTINILQ